MKLYSYYRSSTSYRIRIALNLKGLSYDIVPVNLKTGEQSETAFARINPHKTVPALMSDDNQFVQSLAILDWLENTYPDPAFLPADASAAQLCRELYYAIATEIHAPNNLPVLRYLKTEFGADDQAIEQWYAQWVQRTLAPVEERLAAWNWLSDDLPFGDPSLLEIVLIPQLYNARRWNMDLSACPNLTRIEAYCLELPPFKNAHPDAQPDSPEA